MTKGAKPEDPPRSPAAAGAGSEPEAGDRRRLRELETIVESIPDGVFVVDREERFTVANWTGAVLHGLRPDDVIGRRIADFPETLRLRHFDGRPLQHDEHPLVRALAGEVVRNFEKIVYNKETGRDVYFRVNAAPIHDDGGRIGAVEIARDVTDLRELDVLKDEFIRVAAHELKTPVAIIKGYVGELLRTGGDLPEGRRRMLDALSRGATRLANIVQDLLDVSQLHLDAIHLVVERVELAELVEQVASAAALLSPRHDVRVRPFEPVAVRADPERLKKTLAALVDNAIRYSPEGGEVAIEPRVAGDRSIVSVVDHGIGIPRDRQARIFERFYRAHTDTRYDSGGMGVSLYIARSLARHMGGDLWFESEEGQGSRFHLSVPLWGEHGP